MAKKRKEAQPQSTLEEAKREREVRISIMVAQDSLDLEDLMQIDQRVRQDQGATFKKAMDRRRISLGK